MTRRTIVLGDVPADPLLASLVPDLLVSGRAVTVVAPAAVADLACTATATGLWLGGAPIDELVVRLSLDLLVAPSFADEDRSFTVNELRAFWTHALSLPTVATLNDGRATSMLLRDPGAWRATLGNLGVAVVPATMGAWPEGSWWLRDTGAVSPLPPTPARRALGVTAVAVGGLRTVLCCGGEVPDADRDAVGPAALALAARGVGLADLVVDERDRVVSVVVDPPVGEEDAPWAARRALEWLDAAARR